MAARVQKLFSPFPLGARKEPDPYGIDKVNIFIQSINKLKRACLEDSATIVTELPLLLRSFFLDSPSVLDTLNEFELILLCEVPHTIQETHFSNGYLRNFFIANGERRKTIRFSDFVDLPAGKIDNKNFSIQDAVLALAYNGIIHAQPIKPIHKELYDKLLSVNPRATVAFCKSIATVIIEGLSDVLQCFLGSVDLFALGKYCPSVHNNPSLLSYNLSFMQSPIQRRPNDTGFFVWVLQFKLLNLKLKKSYIASYGSEQLQSLSILQDKSKILISVKSFNARPCTVVLDADLELNYYTIYIENRRQLKVFKNGALVVTKDIGFELTLTKGKHIIGASLDGDMFGYFDYGLEFMMQGKDTEPSMKDMEEKMQGLIKVALGS